MGKANCVKAARMSNFRIKAKVLLPSLALGVCTFIMQSTEEVFSYCALTLPLLKYGETQHLQSVLLILSSVMQFAMLPLIRLYQGAQPIISYNYGANNAYRCEKVTARLLLISCLTYSAISGCLPWWCQICFAAIFTSDPALTEITVWALRIYMKEVACCFGAQIACQQTFWPCP